MSARVNLAPQVYQTNQRNKERKKFATNVTIAIGVTCGILIVGLLVFLGSQKLYIGNLQSSIDESQSKISGMKDLQAAATIEQNLKSWDSINGQKVYLSQFFTVLQDFLPQGVSVSDVSIGADNTLDMSASAKTYSLATKLAKALDAANVSLGAGASSSTARTPYFTNTQLSSVAQDSSGGTVSFKLRTTLAPEVTRGN